MDKMRCGLVVEKAKMVCEEFPVQPMKEGDLLVRTEMAAICGSDLHMVMMGVNLVKDRMKPGSPGHEGIGEVVESNSPHFQKGDRVLTVPKPPFTFCFADYQTIPDHSCIKVPKDIPVDEALMAQQFGTTIFALRQHPADVVGKNVMVVGQGSAGMFFAYMLKRMGAAKVIATDLSEARLDMGKRMGGVDLAVKADGKNAYEAVMDVTGGKGVDYLVEAVGRTETQQQVSDYMNLDGKVLFFGLPESNEKIPFNFHDFFRRRINAKTTFGTQHEPELASFRLALDLIASKQINVSGLVSHSYNIEEINEAMHVANERPARSLKVGVTFK